MSLTIIGENNEALITAGNKFVWPFKISTDAAKVIVGVDVSTNPGDAPDWDVEITGEDGRWNNLTGKNKGEFKANVRGQSHFELLVECPKGARYHDEVSIKLTASAEGQEYETEFIAKAVPSIVALKTQVGQEKEVAKSLYGVFRKKSANEIDEEAAIYAVDDHAFTEDESRQYDVYALLCPAALSGYVFIEGMNSDRMHEKTRGIKKARSFANGETHIQEIEHYLTPLSPVIGIAEGDLVELVSGPFKGEKARVSKIDEEKEEITVELIEAMVPIPVTVTGESVKLIEKEK